MSNAETITVPHLGSSSIGYMLGNAYDASLPTLVMVGSVKGIIPLGTSMDFESRRSRDLGCWDGIAFCTPAIDALAEPVGDDWVIPTELVDAVLKEGLGDDVPPEERAFWHAADQKNYTGDAGRKRVRISSINLRDRDGLHGRLDSVRCPVLRMHGTEDPVYSVANAEHEMKLFVNSPGAELRVVEGGRHFLADSAEDQTRVARLWSPRCVGRIRRRGRLGPRKPSLDATIQPSSASLLSETGEAARASRCCGADEERVLHRVDPARCLGAFSGLRWRPGS
jgi:pimeloyl-ACP methyl ester carboxylesterase